MNYPPGIKWSEIRKELYSPEELECADKVIEIMKAMEEIPNEALTPSPHGQYCQHNGEHPGYECCCDECDFYLACFPDWHPGAIWDEDTKRYI